MSIIFLNFWHQFENLLQIEVFDMPTPLWTFSPHELMINTLKRFPAISRWKGLDAQTNFATEWFLFSRLFSQSQVFKTNPAYASSCDDCQRRKKNFTLILLWRKEISVLICFFFRPKNEFLFFSTAETYVNLSWKPFFSTLNGCVCALNNINIELLFFSLFQNRIFNNLYCSMRELLELHKSKPI